MHGYAVQCIASDLTENSRWKRYFVRISGRDKAYLSRLIPQNVIFPSLIFKTPRRNFPDMDKRSISSRRRRRCSAVMGVISRSENSLLHSAPRNFRSLMKVANHCFMLALRCVNTSGHSLAQIHERKRWTGTQFIAGSWGAGRVSGRSHDRSFIHYAEQGERLISRHTNRKRVYQAQSLILCGIEALRADFRVYQASQHLVYRLLALPRLALAA